jgi:putative membrane protein (TIGR04086 family)
MSSKSTYSARHRKRPSTRKRKKLSSPDQIPKHALRSFGLTVAIGMGMILLSSLVAYFMPDPLSMILPLSYLAMALTALIGGFVAGRLHGVAPLIVGLINGMLLTALVLVVSLFFRSASNGYTAWFSALLHAAVLLLSFLGAFVGTKRTN